MSANGQNGLTIALMTNPVDGGGFEDGVVAGVLAVAGGAAAGADAAELPRPIAGPLIDQPLTVNPVAAGGADTDTEPLVVQPGQPQGGGGGAQPPATTDRCE